MTKRRAGLLVSAGVVTLAVVVIVLNLQPTGAKPQVRPGSIAKQAAKVRAPGDRATSAPADPASAPLRETPIGLEVERNQVRIVAAWHSAVRIAGMAPPPPGDLHLMAHIHAAEGSPHGFAKGEWVPYLTIRYRIEPVGGGQALAGNLVPIASGDGPHYGANIHLPGPGDYRLTYQIEPPATGTFSRLVDPVMGAAPWWEPFAVTFEWSYRPASAPG